MEVPGTAEDDVGDTFIKHLRSIQHIHHKNNRRKFPSLANLLLVVLLLLIRPIVYSFNNHLLSICVRFHLTCLSAYSSHSGYVDPVMGEREETDTQADNGS